MELETHRFALPQLVVAQAHKEITHNEALVLVDALLHPLVEGVATAPPALSINDAGKCWLVGNSPSDSFAGKEDHLAYWTGGSWRFTAPILGMRVWHRPGGVHDQLYRSRLGVFRYCSIAFRWRGRRRGMSGCHERIDLEAERCGDIAHDMKTWRYAYPDEVKSSSCSRLNLLKGDILATV